MSLKKNILLFLVIFIVLISDSCGTKPDTPNSPRPTPTANADSLVSKPNQIGLYPAYTTVNGKQLFGYIDRTGKFAIKPQFEYAADFTKNGVAVVSKNDKYGIINRSGKFVVEPAYINSFDYQDGHAMACDDITGKYNIYNDKGQLLFTFADYLCNYSEGLAGASNSNSVLYGYVDYTGKFIIKPQYHDVGDFKNGKACVVLENNKGCWIDKSGKIISKTFNVGENFDTNSPSVFYDGLEIKTKEASGSFFYGLKDESGKEVLKCKYTVINRINDSLFEAGKVEAPWQCTPKAIFDISGKRLSDFIYYNIEDTGDKLIVSDRYSTYYLNYDGTKVKGYPKIKGGDSIEIIDDLIKVTSQDFEATTYYTLDGKVFWQPNEIHKLTNGLRITESTYFQDRYFIINYPKLDGYKNKTIQNSVNKKLKSMFLSIKDGVDSSPKSNIESQTKVSYSYTLNKNLLVIDMSIYCDGFGAHPNTEQSSYLINLTTGKFYTLGDLFKKGSDYKDVLEVIIADQIKTGKTEADDHNPSIDDAIFFIDSKGNLQIFYNVYEIGCYAAGPITFDIPYEKIIKLIDTKGSFWNSFNRKLPSAASSYSGKPGDVSLDMIKGIINRYEEDITSAISCNEFSYVKPSLYPGSALYNDQKNLVKNLSKKNIWENCVSADVLKTEKINNSTVKAYVHEVISISIGDSKSKDTPFDWVYTLKFSNKNGRYMLSNIEKWNR